jgi:hypothetical protein
MSDCISHSLVAMLTIVSGVFSARYVRLAKNHFFQQTQSVECEVRSENKERLVHRACNGI